MNGDRNKNVTFDDLSLKCLDLTDRIKQQKKIYFRAMPEICTERACLITQFHQKKNEHGKTLFDKFKRGERITILDKAKAYRFVLENRTPIVTHSRAYEKRGRGMRPFEFKETPLFAGSTTTKYKGVPLYPEFLALTLWPELANISKRKSNPYHISTSEVEDLNYRVFPHWLDYSITEVLRKKYFRGHFGSIHGSPMNPMELLERLVFFILSKPECISHTIPDFSHVLELGLRGMIQDAYEGMDKSKTEAQKDFYAAICQVLRGIIAYSNNLADEADALANRESDSVRRAELREIARINRKVPESPAETFREALTSIWICWIAIHLENPNLAVSLGRLDQVLYGYYRDDIEDNRLDVQGALELICDLWLKIGDHVPAMPDVAEQLFGGTGSNQAITVGGVDSRGEDAVNDLTYLMLRATELMKLRDPNLNARYHPDENPPDYLRRLCEVNLNTGATPAIHNDRAVIQALKAAGDDDGQARDYGIIGCVEPGSNGRSYCASSSILLNLTSALELTLFNGKHRHTGIDEDSPRISPPTGDPETFEDFEQFRAAFETQTRWLIEQATGLNNRFGEIHQRVYPTPILSAFFEGPMKRGRDLIEGGAEINSSGATVIGLADVADSLSAIQKAIFDKNNKRRVSFGKLLNALKHNFEGDDALQKRLSNPDKTPKYGNEHPDADANASWIVVLLANAFGDTENYRGGHYRVGYWTMTNHAGLGRLIGAMPNGRKAEENFTSGITPVSGVTPHLSKTLNSVAKLPPQCLTNGVALNLKYTPADEGRARMLNDFAASVEGYFASKGVGSVGGMEIQFNIIDRKTLEKAVHNPDEFPELLVRVSGYTAYFKDLNPRMKKEIIDRTEYLLSTGDMQFHEPFQLPKVG